MEEKQHYKSILTCHFVCEFSFRMDQFQFTLIRGFDLLMVTLMHKVVIIWEQLAYQKSSSTYRRHPPPPPPPPNHLLHHHNHHHHHHHHHHHACVFSLDNILHEQLFWRSLVIKIIGTSHYLDKILLLFYCYC